MKGTPRELRTTHAEFPWREIAGARDALSHECFRGDLRMAWVMVHQDLPLLEPHVTRRDRVTLRNTEKRAPARPKGGPRILVLGGTRFVGSHVVEAALAAGHRVDVFSSGSSPIPPGTRHVPGDAAAHGWQLVAPRRKRAPQSRRELHMKITVETTVRAPLDTVWRAWTTPDDMVRWNAASDDWHTTAAAVDLRVGGAFSSRMEAKDGSMGFDFEGTYAEVEPMRRIAYAMADDRTCVVEFQEEPGGESGRLVRVREVFDAESANPVELQRQGWQAILDNFARYVEAGR